MAKKGATQAASPEVKQLAAQIQAAQDPEINTMTGWLNAWGQPTSMSGMTGHSMDSMPGMMNDADMTKLGTLSGSAFDRQFLTMMTAHHTGAIAWPAPSWHKASTDPPRSWPTASSPTRPPRSQR